MDKIWLKNYPAHVRPTIDPEIYASLVAMFETRFAEFAEYPGYSSFDVTLTYRQMDELSRDFAAYLQNQLKLQKGQRFAIMLPNCLQYPVALFGALRAGLTVVNVNPLYTANELEHQLYDAEAEGILVLANFAHELEQALPKTKVKHVIVTQLGDLLGFPKKLLINFILKYIKKAVPNYSIAETHGFSQALKKGKSLSIQPVEITGEDVAFLQYTGGTTGVSKGAVLTHKNIVANVLQIVEWVGPRLRHTEEVMVTPLPLYHIFSLTSNLFVFGYVGAINLLITNPRDIPSFIKTLRKAKKLTAITAVNTLYNALMNHPDFTKIDFSELNFIVSGGMALQKSVADRWEAKTGKVIVEGYGLTETSPVVVINRFDIEHYDGFMGAPLPSTDVRICNDQGEEVAIGEQGELWVKGPQVMRGYWNMPEETKHALIEDGWFKTGDIVEMDQRGFLRAVDRKKDIIIVSGFNVYPNEIEDIIARHPGVLEVAVVGLTNSDGTEQVKAFIVKKDLELTPEEVTKHCREYLTAYKVPKYIEFKDDLPKNNVGKVLRRALRE